jgi:hypothetical protein
VLLTRLSFVNHAGIVVSEVMEAHALPLPRGGNRRECRLLIARARTQLASSIINGGSAADFGHGMVAPRDAIRERLQAIGTQAVDPREEQSSLFDRRAERAVLAREGAFRTLEASLSRMLRAIAPAVPQRTRVELIAAWPEMRR